MRVSVSLLQDHCVDEASAKDHIYCKDDAVSRVFCYTLSDQEYRENGFEYIINSL